MSASLGADRLPLSKPPAMGCLLLNENITLSVFPGSLIRIILWAHLKMNFGFHSVNFSIQPVTAASDLCYS